MQIVAKKALVLVAEDDTTTNRIYAEALRKAGYDVATATSGVDCLRRLYTDKIDVLILDLMMPGVSGWDVLHVKSHDARIALIPVIVITGLEARAARNKPLEGVSLILEKPFSIEKLLHALYRLLP